MSNNTRIDFKSPRSEILYNKVKCGYCLQIIESKHVHDFVMCGCGKSGVDGGHEYLRRIGDNCIELSEIRYF